MVQYPNIFPVDLDSGSVSIVSIQQICKGDAYANRVGAQVYKDGQPVALGGSCMGKAILANGQTVPMPNGQIDGNLMYVDLLPACYAVEGPIKISLVWQDGDKRTTVLVACGNVMLTESGVVIDPGEIIPSVSALITSINDAIASIPADYSDLLAAIAPNYADLVFPVSAGTWCWHEGDLYRAKVDIPASETWTAAHWETAPLSNSLAADIKNRVSYAAAQTLTETQQATARDNIGAADQSTVSALSETVTGMGDELTTRIAQAETDLSDRVAYSVQVTSDLQKTRARNNIGAAAAGDVADLESAISSVVKYESKEDQPGETQEITGFTSGKTLNYQTGAVTDTTSNYAVSDFIDLSNVIKAYRYGATNTKFYFDTYCLYDSSKTYLVGYDQTTSYDFETIDGHEYSVPYNLLYQGNKAAYMRIRIVPTQSFTRNIVLTGASIYDFEYKETRDARTDYSGVNRDSLASALSNSYQQIAEAIDEAAQSSEKDYKLFGTTPCLVNSESVSDIRVDAGSDNSVRIQGITVADFDHMGTKTYNNIALDTSYTGHGICFKLTSLASPQTNYRLNGKADNLVVGATYRLCLKVTDPNNDPSGGGHYAQIYCKGSQARSFDGYDPLHGIYTNTFVATETSHDFYVYPFLSNNASGYTQQVGDTFVIDDFYINRVITPEIYNHDAVFLEESTDEQVDYALAGRAAYVTATSESDVLIALYDSKLLTVNGKSPDSYGNIVVKSILQGKKAVSFGDSITERFVEIGTDYPAMVAENTGMDVFNAGVGGSTMHVRNLSDWDVVCFKNLADMIYSGDWSALVALGNNSSFEKKERAKYIAPILSAIDWDDVDYITVAFGANDISTDAAASVIDNENNRYDTSTFLGSFRYGIEKIWSLYPHIKFLVLTPIFRWWTINSEYVSSDTREMAGGHLYDDWGQALIKCCAEEYHVPVVDMYNTLGMNTPTHLYYFNSNDGTHPNQKGIDLMGMKVSSAIVNAY